VEQDLPKNLAFMSRQSA